MSGEIFVVGASRSGTNLVRALLNAHSALWVSAETHYFDDLRPRLPRGPLEGDARRLAEDYFLALSHRAFGQDGDPEQSTVEREELRSVAAGLGGTGDAYFEALCRLRARRHGRERWGEKTPRHVYRIDDLLAAFPEARVVCLVRDPRAVAASYKDWHGAGAGETPEKQADRERTRRSYHPVLMSLLWRGVVRSSFAALRRHGPERVRIQRFERLAAAPEAEARELCDWLGLAFEPAMLEIGVVNSSYATAGSGVSSEPVDRWRERLTPAEVATVQSVCGALMDELGYQRAQVPASWRRVAGAWATAPVAVARAAVLNRRRLGKATEYVRTRAGTALSRRPL